MQHNDVIGFYPETLHDFEHKTLIAQVESVGNVDRCFKRGFITGLFFNRGKQLEEAESRDLEYMYVQGYNVGRNYLKAGYPLPINFWSSTDPDKVFRVQHYVTVSDGKNTIEMSKIMDLLNKLLDLDSTDEFYMNSEWVNFDAVNACVADQKFDEDSEYGIAYLHLLQIVAAAFDINLEKLDNPLERVHGLI